MTVPANLPPDEINRLARLRALAILDTQPEEIFDNVVKIAAELCGVPISLVSLIDADRQWFKANVGLSEAIETPRDIAFCSHAILGDQVMEIPDARLDPRFAENPLVTGEPGICFYAGAPLILTDGTRIGTLCVIDRQPKKLSQSQMSMLEKLATVAVHGLEFRERSKLAVQTLLSYEEHLKRLYDTTPAMLHTTDEHNCITAVSDLWLKKLGYQRKDVLGRNAAEFLTLASRQLALQHVWPEMIRSGFCNDVEFQMLCKDGDFLDVSFSAIAEYQTDGNLLQTLAVITEVTATKIAERELFLSEAHYRTLVEDQSELVSLATSDGLLTFVNGAYARHFGLEPQAMTGKSLFDYVAEQDRAAVATHLQNVCECRVPIHDENQMEDANGRIRWVAWTNRALLNAEGQVAAIHSVGRDITEQRQAERTLRENEKFLYRTGQVAGVGGWEVDLDSGDVHWSDMTCQLHDVPPGYKPKLEEAIAFYTPNHRPIIEQAVRDGIEHGKAWDLELLLVSAKGRNFWARATGSVELQNGKPVRLIGSLLDITSRKEIEDKLAESAELLQVTLDSIGDAVITTDVNNRIRWLNPVAEQLTGWTRAEASGRLLTQVFVILNEETRAAVDDPVAKCLAEVRITDLPSNTILISRSGKEYGIEDTVAPIRDTNGHFHGAVLVFHDVSDKRRVSRDVSYRATHDVLTGLINREEFERRLEQTLESAKRDHMTGALMYIDLDQFKLVNDSCGHAIGDKLLCDVSTLFQSCVRGRDTVARVGGDEFCIILERCDMENAQRIATTICDRMDEFRFIHDGRRFRVGASIGLVTLDERWANKAMMLQAADSSCYAAKEAGRNRVHTWFDTDRAMKVRQGEAQWVTRLEQALEENRFVLYAQQIVPIGHSSNGLHFEVLLRLRENEVSIIPPGVFLPAAERFHMATRIDRWVINHAFDWLENLRDGINGVHLVSINLSGQSVGDKIFHQHLIQMIGRAQFDVSKLCFEITETAAIANIIDAKQFIDEVRALGVKIALDDFGAGASSFGYLKTLPVDFLKIDGQFITDLLDDKLDEAAVRSFQAVAKVVGVKTIAEFVEREDVLATLQQIGVDMAQGYLIHRPEPISQMAALLLTEKQLSY